MLIKASRITNLTDARYFAAKEVDFLGFNLEEGTEGYLDPMYMKAIREWVEGPKITGEFSRASTAYVREAVTFFGLDAVQVTAKYAMQVADLQGIEVILEVDASVGFSTSDLQSLSPFVSYFLLKLDGTQLSVPNLREQLSESLLPKILLQTDATAEQLAELLEVLKPAGLSLVGGEEEQVGVKSFDEIEAIFEMLGR
jgi:phosphoribosylanthranilate isomerase